MIVYIFASSQTFIILVFDSEPKPVLSVVPTIEAYKKTRIKIAAVVQNFIHL
jgi:hypothetical protein